MINYYKILVVSQSASDADIKAAFKKKAVQYHPDKNDDDPESEELFKQVNAAYQILSNSYEKARYDLKLKFGERSIDYPSSPPPPYRYPGNQPRGATVRVSRKANEIATMWAFGFSLGIAILVMTSLQLYDMYNQYRQDIMLEGRREIFNDARDYHAAGNVSLSLSTLASLQFFYEEEEDIETFKKEILEDLLQNGTRKFYLKQYKEAITDLVIYDEYVSNKRPSFEILLAEAYMLAQNYDEAIARFNKIIIQGNETINNYLTLAWIFRHGKKDYNRALSYYELASRMAINGYKSIYGDAYLLLLSPKVVSPDHFEIFHGMAETFFLIGNYDRALNAIKWNALMWPDYPENHILRGQIFQMQGKTRLACQEFNIAIDKGWEEGVRCSG
ncbi:MAG: DnaJ domain-containing protein [Bacteroidetes bacterium]|nr:DnaJ domain-containing protein [Bacteroidota bacterium]MDA1120726.1 DnaJ domain-containing protein [Bacteroidota bacterium]